MSNEARRSSPSYLGPLRSVLVTIGVFFGSQIIGAILFGTLFRLFSGDSGLTADDIQSSLAQNHWLYLVFVISVESLIVVATVTIMRQRYVTFKALGYGRLRLKYLGYAVLGYLSVFIANVFVVAVIAKLVPSFDTAQQQELGLSVQQGDNPLPLFIALVLIPPLVEEFIMRGFLFTNLRAKLSFWWAAVAVSLLFGLAHITQASDGLFLVGALNFFVLSIGLCYLREKTSSIWPSVGVHMLQNGIAFAVLYLR